MSPYSLDHISLRSYGPPAFADGGFAAFYRKPLFLPSRAASCLGAQPALFRFPSLVVSKIKT